MPDDSLAAQGADLGLTISGGISLGAYEAGANWAIVEYIKHTQADPKKNGQKKPLILKVVTGASAGNINTLLTAVQYCQSSAVGDENGSKEGGPSNEHRAIGVDNNVFWNTWTPVGFDGLHPRRRTCEQFTTDLETVWRPYGWSSDLRSDDLHHSCDESARSGYSSQDGLLSRQTFGYAIDLLRDRMENGLFEENCSVVLGMTVTAVKPIKTPGSLETKRATFSALAEAKTGADRHLDLWAVPPIRDDKRPEKDPPKRPISDEYLIGDRIHFPVADGLKPNDKVSLDLREVFNLVQASSAFPGAFSPVPLEVCLDEDLHGDSCVRGNPDEGKRPETRLFFDGGVFDNLPIGLALPMMFQEAERAEADNAVLVEDQAGDEVAAEVEAKNPQRRVLYLDPDRRRDRADEHEKEKAAVQSARGLGGLLPMVGDLVEIGRTRELQRAGDLQEHFFNKGKWKVDLDAVTRGGGVFGEHLGAFGAFASLPMREYDFLVGVYDGMYKMARLECTSLKSGHAEPACVARSVHEQSDRLGLDKSLSGAGAYIAQRMLRNDLRRDANSFEVERSLRDTDICWLEGFGKATHGNGGPLTCSDEITTHSAIRCYRGAFYEDLGSPECKLRDDPPAKWDRLGNAQARLEPIARVSGLRQLVERLPYTSATVARISGVIPESEKEIFDSYSEFVQGLVVEGLGRMVNVEREDAANGAKGTGEALFSAATAAAQIYYSSIAPRTFNYSSSIPRFDSFPAISAIFVPYHVSLRTGAGGGEAGYRLALMSRYLGATATYAPIVWTRARGELSMKPGLGIVVPLHNPVVPQFDLTGIGSWIYRPGDTAYVWRAGGELAMYLVANRLRLAVSHEYPLDIPDGGGVTELIIGLSDINGLWFWALGGARD